MTAAPSRKVRNPFPGLRPFRDDEEHLFFGRENQVDRMLDKLAAHRFLAVVGTSGSGKSSLVNCGLRPALHRGYMASAGASWRMVQFRPGSDPIGAMAQKLAEDGVLFDAWHSDGLTARELVETTLRLGSLGVVDIVEQARLPEGMQLLVVVDQFEELFRYRALAAEAANSAFGPGQDAIAFVKLLLEARRQRKMPIHIVLTMRSDFLGECAQFLGLAEAINDSQYLVPRLTREEIRAAIEGPVGVADASITQVLVTRLLNDVGDNPDQLSILQHALNRTWANWENEGGGQGPLDLPHYEAIGGMADALNRHAERAFGELGSGERKRLAERVFKALTDKGTDPRGIRRPTRLAQLGYICGSASAELEAVFEVFRKPSRSFLMPPVGEKLTPDSWIDISHESLMRVWKRLADWATDEAESSRRYRRLSEAAMLWRGEESGLLHDPALRAMLEWRAKSQPNPAWAAQYQGSFDSVEEFLKQHGETRSAQESDADLQRRWLAGRWKEAVDFLDRSRDAQLRENLEAEIERRWLASWWRYLPFAVMAMVFIVGQSVIERGFKSKFESYVNDKLPDAKNALTDTKNAFQAVTRQAGTPEQPAAASIPKPDNDAAEKGDWTATLVQFLGGLVKVLFNVIMGPPAAYGYILLAPYARKRFDDKARTDIERESATVADTGAAAGAKAATTVSAIAVHATTYATFGRRMLAHVLDWIISYLAWIIIYIALVAVIALFGIGIVASEVIFGLLSIVTFVLVPWLYHAWSLSLKHQATPGMWIVGIFATDLQGQRMSFLRATARHFASMLSYFTVLVGFLMQPFNERRQTLHDLLCGTVVLRRKPKTG